MIVIALCYLWIYPRYAQADTLRVALLDLAAVAFVLFVVGFRYGASKVDFTLLSISVNWFWFTLSIYLFIEIPFALWYIRKFDLRL